MYQSNRKGNLRTALLMGAATASVFSLASTAQAQPVENVLVTGSHIPQPGLTSASPLTVTDAEEVKFRGTVHIETLLNTLPMTFATYSQNEANGASGTATVDLRGIGTARTLVLIDGKRMMPGDPRLPVADLNSIPGALVERVEIVTGGASAVYGSDALAGVVNFIMKRDFEGVIMDAQYRFNWHENDDSEMRRRLDEADLVLDGNFAPGFEPPPGTVVDGETYDANIVVGVNSADGKGNVTVYAGYRYADAVTQDQRDFSTCSLLSVVTDYICLGSSNYNRFFSLDGAGQFFATTGREFVPWTSVPRSERFFNFAPFNHFQRPDERFTLGAFGHYEVDPALDIYVDVMFSDDHTKAQIAPSGAFLSTVLYINCDNPLMSAQQQQELCTDVGLGAGDNATLLIGRRNIEGGPRFDDLRHTSYRIVAGARGDLVDGWHYDFFGQYGKTLFVESYHNELSKQRVQNALLVDPVTGNCTVTDAGIDNDCVPLDYFGGFGAVTDEMLNYVGATGLQQGSTQEEIVGLVITGDLGQYGLQTRWADSGMAVAFGGEYRREQLDLLPSRDFQLDDLFGQGGATLPVPQSAFDVLEGFVEARFPIVTGMRFIELLQIEAGFRQSSYSESGDVSSYKVLGEYAPTQDIKFRASYQRAVRAPNVLELFTPQNNVLFGGQDPCAGNTNPNGLTAAQCVATGATLAQLGTAFGGTSATGIPACPSSQCRQLVGGNPNLRPEESDTESFGIVFTPTFHRFLQGFNATVDWWSIEVSDAIGGPSPTATLAACVASGNAASVECQRIVRDPAAGGALFTDNAYVRSLNENLNQIRTSGLDIEANYQSDLADLGMGDHGSIAINFLGTYLDEFFFSSVNTDCAGHHGLNCGYPNPTWRHRMRVTWTTPWDIQLSVLWRHMGESNLEGPGHPVDAHISTWDWFDIAGNWQVSDNLVFRAGINNVFDKDPPIVDSNYYGISAPAFGSGNTWPNVYDTLGRQVFFGATLTL